MATPSTATTISGLALRLVRDVRAGDASLTGLPPERLIGLEDPERLQEYVEELLDAGEAEVVSRMLKTPGDPEAAPPTPSSLGLETATEPESPPGLKSLTEGG